MTNRTLSDLLRETYDMGVIGVDVSGVDEHGIGYTKITTRHLKDLYLEGIPTVADVREGLRKAFLRSLN